MGVRGRRERISGVSGGRECISMGKQGSACVRGCGVHWCGGGMKCVGRASVGRAGGCTMHPTCMLLPAPYVYVATSGVWCCGHLHNGVIAACTG